MILIKTSIKIPHLALNVFLHIHATTIINKVQLNSFSKTVVTFVWFAK